MDVTWPGNELEEVLAASLGNPSAGARLVEVLGRSPVWVPLPNGGGPDSADLDLATMEIDGAAYVPVFSSEEQFLACVGSHMSFTVAPARDFARGLPPQLGIAVNPGGIVGVPLPPCGRRRALPRRPHPARRPRHRRPRPPLRARLAGRPRRLPRRRLRRVRGHRRRHHRPSRPRQRRGHRTRPLRRRPARRLGRGRPQRAPGRPRPRPRPRRVRLAGQPHPARHGTGPGRRLDAGAGAPLLPARRRVTDGLFKLNFSTAGQTSAGQLSAVQTSEQTW